MMRAALQTEQDGDDGRSIALASPSMIGSANRLRILQALYDFGPMSRVEMARQANVNRTTITGIVQPLLADGLLVEGDAVPPSMLGGKPARRLFFNPDAPAIAALLLLPGKICTCLVTLTGDISAFFATTFSPADTTEDVTRLIEDQLAQTLAAASHPPFGIGIAAGGMVDSDRGVIVTVNLAPALNNLALVDRLAARFNLPATIDHHPRALLLGDRWFGLGRSLHNFAAVYTGEVLGGALYLDGQVYRGLSGSGGELGHTIVQIDGSRCNCGNHGCWETVATLSWLRNEARARGFEAPETLSTRRLLTMVENGITEAEPLLDLYARNLAIGIANLQQTMSPNDFILHGDAAAGGEAMAMRIKQQVEAFTRPRPSQQIKIVMNRGNEDHVALKGAAGLVLSKMLKPAM
ncbi:ROK family transcriptional regulator [Sodalis praecaptivus]|nr:ROK family transcriptional regulator [Sodalis praecaptivus]